MSDTTFRKVGPGRLPAFYSCELCGLKDSHCDVPARKDGEGVVEWFERAIEAVAQHHRLASPDCRPERLVDLHIATGGDPNKGIGYYEPPSGSASSSGVGTDNGGSS